MRAHVTLCPPACSVESSGGAVWLCHGLLIASCVGIGLLLPKKPCHLSSYWNKEMATSINAGGRLPLEIHKATPAMNSPAGQYGAPGPGLTGLTPQLPYHQLNCPWLPNVSALSLANGEPGELCSSAKSTLWHTCHSTGMYNPHVNQLVASPLEMPLQDYVPCM